MEATLHSSGKFGAPSRIVIAGAGRFGRELRVGLETYGGYEFIGFIDDIVKAGLVIGCISSHAPLNDALYLVAVGNSEDRLAIGRTLIQRGATLASVVSPRALVANTYSDKPGTMLLGMADVSANVTLGSLIVIHGFAVVAHDCIIEDGATIGNHVFLGGGARIGEAATVHPHSVVLPNRRIGARSIVGAGSVVTIDVPDDCTVFGSPARIIVQKPKVK